MQKKIRKKLFKKLLITCGISLSLLGSATFLNAVPALANEAPMVKTVLVKDITYSGNTRMTNKQIEGLLPELKKNKVDVDILSRQIQLANDSGAINLAVNFVMDKEDKATAVITVKELPSNHTFLSLDNTGTKETGDYRTALTYVNTNTSGQADTLGISYVTSPDHTSEVKQAAVFYKMLLPRTNDSVYMVYTHSDVRMGRIAQIGSFGIEATGQGNTFGLHYQKNLVYQPNNRSSLDFGVDFQHYDNTRPVYVSGSYIGDIGDGKVDTTMVGVTYNNLTRGQSDAFSYNIGYSRNVGGSQGDYDRLANDKSFGIAKYGLNYQHKYQNNWVANLKINGQLTNNTLIKQAKLGAGGMYTVRGFVEQPIQADSGIIASLEFYTPEIAKGLRMLVFTDYAQLCNNHSQTGMLHNANLASVGLGWRYGDQNGWNARVDYGFVIEGKEYNLNHDNGRLHMAVSKKF